MAEEVMTMEFDDDFKHDLIRIIKRSLKSEPLSQREVTILFNWVRHQTDPAFEFVPMKYRTVKVPTKKKGKK